MKNKTLLLYTHTDCSDLWFPCFNRLEKYMNHYDFFICLNKDSSLVPKKFSKIFYDESRKYTERLRCCLSQIEEMTILFTHEDMILYDSPIKDDIDRYFSYIDNKLFDSIKLLSHGECMTPSDVDKNLYYSSLSGFSIQPTIIKKSRLEMLINSVGECDIWTFESNFIDYGKNAVVRRIDNIKRGIFHYDNPVYPYIATAVVRGKWNVSEYPKELNEIFLEYDIDPRVRGVI